MSSESFFKAFSRDDSPYGILVFLVLFYAVLSIGEDAEKHAILGSVALTGLVFLIISPKNCYIYYLFGLVFVGFFSETMLLNPLVSLPIILSLMLIAHYVKTPSAYQFQIAAVVGFALLFIPIYPLKELSAALMVLWLLLLLHNSSFSSNQPLFKAVVGSFLVINIIMFFIYISDLTVKAWLTIPLTLLFFVPYVYMLIAMLALSKETVVAKIVIGLLFYPFVSKFFYLFGFFVFLTISGDAIK